VKAYTVEEFLDWARERGLRPDSRYPGSTYPTFAPNPDLYRFWEFPRDAATRPRFLSRMLGLAGPWQSCFVRRLGGWPVPDATLGAGERVAHQILTSLGLPMGTEHIACFDVSEVDALLSLLLVSTIFGGSALDDLFLVLDPPRYLLKTEHHGVMQVCFRSRADLDDYVRAMETTRFPLPSSAPDEAFRPQSWIVKQANRQVTSESGAA
jgi:hypothetical protein